MIYTFNEIELTNLSNQLDQLNQYIKPRTRVFKTLQQSYKTWFKVSNKIKKTRGSAKPLTNDQLYWLMMYNHTIESMSTIKTALNNKSVQLPDDVLSFTEDEDVIQIDELDGDTPSDNIN